MADLDAIVQKYFPDFPKEKVTTSFEIVNGLNGGRFGGGNGPSHRFLVFRAEGFKER